MSPKITADGDYSHEIKRQLLLAKKVMTNLGSILKSRDITLMANVHIIKAMIFPVVMFGCDHYISDVFFHHYILRLGNGESHLKNS